jgi:hypothetical protein
MAATNNDILELKFEGENVNPSTIKPHEVAELIINFEKSLLATVKQQNPEIDTDVLLFSFESIQNNSLDLRFVTLKAKEIIIASYTLLSTSIANENYSSLTHDAVDGLKEISKFSRRYNCTGYFNYNGRSLTSFNPETKVDFDRQNEIKGETVIHGKLLRIGGETPMVHLKINNEYNVKFDVKEAIAKKLAGSLYETVSLSGTAKWDKKSYKILDFRVNDIIETEDKPLNETFNELRNNFGKYWDNIDDINAVIK